MFARAAALATIALLTACADGGDAKNGTVPVKNLSQIVGSYTAVNTAQSPTPLVKGSVLTMQIRPDAIIVQAGCNTMSGPASAADSHLVAGDLAITEMACAPELMAQDTWLAAHLAKRPRIDWSGPYVSLVWDDGWLGFDKSLAPEPGMTGDPDTPVSSSPTS
ncbi:MAG TPA: META domain-containing protein [Tetrasphaera sp.]|uniref:META domain-containing protein n=1 Tax=Nostocoides sp. TaxID=1917966 RepID=UPI002B70ADCF|nr:META domain-containing protein [Tetrasphaera sp.]HNQ08695.1 META domain-containing protein [Tetrasphaera sp.]